MEKLTDKELFLVLEDRVDTLRRVALGPTGFRDEHQRTKLIESVDEIYNEVQYRLKHKVRPTLQG